MFRHIFSFEQQVKRARKMKNTLASRSWGLVVKLPRRESFLAARKSSPSRSSFGILPHLTLLQTKAGLLAKQKEV